MAQSFRNISKLSENGPLEISIKSNAIQCPHLSIQHCPSPKKGLAHAIVQCNIHLGRISDPRILPCGHSFCCRCLLVLAEEQKPRAQNSRSPFSSEVNLICPLCRRDNRLESIESLTINFAISDLLEIFDAEEKEEERIRRETLSEMEHTVGILKSLEDKIDRKLNMSGYDTMYTGHLKDAAIATQKRQSYLGHLAQDIEDERDRAIKERLIKNLHFTCLAYQRLAEMSDGELRLSGDAFGASCMKDFIRMYKSIIVLEYRPTATMTERRSRVWFTIVFSLLIQQCWTSLESRRFIEVAKFLSFEFSRMFDEQDGVWIAVVGRRPLGCWIWKDEHDYACLDIADFRLIIYRRALGNGQRQQETANHKILYQNHLEKILAEAVHLKEKDGYKDLNMAKLIRERLQNKFEGSYWHVAAGHSGEFAVCASAKEKEIVLEMWNSEAGQWKALVWQG